MRALYTCSLQTRYKKPCLYTYNIVFWRHNWIGVRPATRDQGYNFVHDGIDDVSIIGIIFEDLLMLALSKVNYENELSV